MNEMQMLEKLEEARKASERTGMTIYAMSNGTRVCYCDTRTGKSILEDIGYWLCSIFENGHRVEA